MDGLVRGERDAESGEPCVGDEAVKFADGVGDVLWWGGAEGEVEFRHEEAEAKERKLDLRVVDLVQALDAPPDLLDASGNVSFTEEGGANGGA